MRPSADPGLYAAVAATAPPRAQKRLETEPGLADAWAWSADGDVTVVTTDSGEKVTVKPKDGVVHPDGLTCTCLLSPRCLHVLAVARALPVAASGAGEDARPHEKPPHPVAAGGPAGGTEAGEAARPHEKTDPPEIPTPAPEPEPEPARVTLTAAQREATAAVWRAAASLVVTGASATGPLAQAELLRASHGARAAGLHRLHKAAVRVVRHARDLHRNKPQFALPALVADLEELLLVASSLARFDEVSERWIGTARRAYEPVGNLKLSGLFVEPVIAGTGYAGVVTWVADAKGRLWQVSDVMPGGPVRARAAYDGPAGVGGASVTHRRLAREGLYVQDATASFDGRLGSGQDVRAVRAGPSSWSDPGPAARFAEPFASQLDRAFASRAGGADLLFLTGEVVGAEKDALVVAVGGLPVRVVAPSDHAELAWRDNLRLLARAPGLALRLVARVVAGRRRTVAGLAAGVLPPAPERPSWRLPDDWGDHVDLGLQRLQSSHVDGLADQPVALALPETSAADPLEPLRRRVHRLALGGRSTLPPEGVSRVEREAAAFQRTLMPTAAAALRALQQAALAARADDGADPLARAFLAASSYDRAAARALSRSTWE